MEFVRSSLEQLFMIPKAIFRLCFIIVNNAYCIPTYVIWMILLLPVRKINPDTYWRIEGYFFHWLLAMVSMWSWSAGYDVVETGDDITECLDARTLVLSNHQSTADVPFLMACFNARRNVLPNLMWIMDSLFKYTNFGVVSVLHQDFFIMSGKSKRDQSISDLVHHLLTSYIPRGRNWLVLFPEGGFLRKRRANSQLYAERNQLPVLQHVTLPRVGAMTAIMKTLGPPSACCSGGNCGSCGGRVTDADMEQRESCGGGGGCSGEESVEEGCGAGCGGGAAAAEDPLLSPPPPPSSSIHHQLAFILDITIAYPDGPNAPLDLKAILFGHRPPCRTTLLYRLYRCTAEGGVPSGGAELAQWLFTRWQEKDRLLAAFYRTGRFPTGYKVYEGGSTGAGEGVDSSGSSEGVNGGSRSDLTETQQMPTTLVSQDCLRFLILHLFFITSTYVHILMFLAAYEYATYFISH